jgi:hypothetical protein
VPQQSRVALLLAVLGLGLGTGTNANAQSWTVDAAAGHARYEGLRTRADGPNALLSLTYRSAFGGWAYLAGGTPLDGFTLPWGALGFGGRAASRGAVNLGIDAAGHGYLYSERESATSGDGGILHLRPFVGYGSPRARAELYSGYLHHHARGPAGDSTRAAHDSGLRLNLVPTGAATIDAEARLLRIGGENHPFAGARASYRRGTVLGWASAGAWFGDSAEGWARGAGASVQLRPALSLHLSLHQETVDPLFGNQPRRSWSIGVTRRLGPASRSGPSGVRIRGGRVTLLVPRSESPDGLSVAGEFNGWSPIEMSESGRYWSIELSLAPGVHRYAFRRPDGSWFVPPEWHRRMDDGMGGDVAILVVP